MHYAPNYVEKLKLVEIDAITLINLNTPFENMTAFIG
jgi:hypothetical protein